MFNRLKHFLNSILGDSFKVEVIVNSPTLGHYFGKIIGTPRQETLLFIFGNNDLIEVITVDKVTKIDNVYHIKYKFSDYTVRIL